jgi:hypothetical protein
VRDSLETDFPLFRFDRPASGVLRLTLDTGRENNVIDGAQHEQMANVWPAISGEPDVRAVVVRGAGEAPEAIRGSKAVLNLWLRQFAPIFEASAALEVSGFGGSAIRALLASVPSEDRP